MKTIILTIYLFFHFACFAQDQNENALFELGLAYERSGEMEKASEIFQKLYDKYPNNFNFYNSYRNNLEYFKKYDKAIITINNWLTNHPNDISQMANLGLVYKRLNNDSKCEEIWNYAIKLSPKDINTYRILASINLESRFYEIALAFYLKGRIACNTPNEFIMETASIYAFLQDYENSIIEYLKLVKLYPNQIGYIQSLFTPYVEDTTFLKTAIKILEKEYVSNSNDLTIVYLLSWLYGESKEYQKAMVLHIKLDKARNSFGAEIYNFAERAFRDRVFDIASEAYKYLIENFPNSNLVQNSSYYYVLCLEEKLNRYDNSEDSTFFVKNFKAFNKTSYDSVIEGYKKILTKYPNTIWAMESNYRLGKLLFEKYNDLDQSKKYFQTNVDLRIINSLFFKSSIKIGDILFLQNNISEAMKVYEKIVSTENPENSFRDLARYKIAEIYYINYQFAKSKAILNDIMKNLNSDLSNDAILFENFIESNIKTDSNLMITYCNGEKLLKQNKLSEALIIFGQIGKEFPNVDLVSDVFFKICEIKIRMLDYNGAIAVLESMLKNENIEDIDKATLIMAEIYQFGLKKKEFAITAYDKILKDFPNSLYLNYARKRTRELRGEIGVN